MDEKIYETLKQFLEQLRSSSKDWRDNSDLVCHQLATYNGVLKIFGSNKAEILSRLLAFAAILATEPQADDNYPTINFIDGRTD